MSRYRLQWLGWNKRTGLNARLRLQPQGPSQAGRLGVPGLLLLGGSYCAQLRGYMGRRAAASVGPKGKANRDACKSHVRCYCFGSRLAVALHATAAAPPACTLPSSHAASAVPAGSAAVGRPPQFSSVVAIVDRCRIEVQFACNPVHRPFIPLCVTPCAGKKEEGKSKEQVRLGLLFCCCRFADAWGGRLMWLCEEQAVRARARSRRAHLQLWCCACILLMHGRLLQPHTCGHATSTASMLTPFCCVAFSHKCRPCRSTLSWWRS